MFDLTAFQRDLLFTISGFEEPHGLKLKRSLQEDYEEEISNGRLYPNLGELVDRGLIRKGKLDDRANTYQITRQGLRVLRRRRQWEEQSVPDGLVGT